MSQDGAPSTNSVAQDIFLYAVIVPIMPFSLETQVGLEADRVQYWVSISLAVYGAALLIFSRMGPVHLLVPVQRLT